MRVHTFRQSDLEAFYKCPHQFDLRRRNLLPRKETDATALGTSMHAGIEAVLRGECGLADGEQVAVEAWRALQDDVEYVQDKTAATVERKVRDCYGAWAQDVFPMLGGTVAVEHRFKVLLHSDQTRQLWLSGTIDYIDEALGLVDWKTAGRRYEEWEKRRFAIQPTVYSYAAWREGLVDLDHLEMVPFTYAVMVKGRKQEVQIVTVERGPQHWQWLTAQATRLANLIEAEVDAWPLNDQGWHCSPKWCTAWDSCKGGVLNQTLTAPQMP